MLKLTEKTIVVPGTLLAVDEVAGPGTYIETNDKENEVYSKHVGIFDMKNKRCRVIPLSGVYEPRKGDKIIARVEEVSFNHWQADINSFILGMMPLSEVVKDYVDLSSADLSDYYDVGDYVYIQVSKVTKKFSVKLSMRDRMCRPLKGGKIISITPSKVPRVIGKGGSMVEVIKKKTGSKIIVGQNGVVWVSGGDEEASIKAVKEVEKKSHTSGLTSYIDKKLDDWVDVEKVKTEEKKGKKSEKKSKKKPEKKPKKSRDKESGKPEKVIEPEKKEVSLKVKGDKDGKTDKE